MTRGYLCIVEKGEVKSVCFLSSDAYLSYYGLEILEAVIRGDIEQYVSDMRKNTASYGKKGDPCRGFMIEWINGNKDESEEKGYIYDSKTGVLKAYERGSLLYTVKPEERERYKYIFANDCKLETVLSYDAEKMSYHFESVKNAKRIAKMTDSELEYIVAKYDEERLELDDTHCVMPGHYVGHEVYRKLFRSSDCKRNPLEFIVEHCFGRWCVLLQTPFGRYRIIAKDFGSEAGAVKAIRELIRTIDTEKFFRLSQLFSEYKEAKGDEEKEEALINSLKERWEKEPWYTGGGNITVNSIIHNIRQFR